MRKPLLLTATLALTLLAGPPVASAASQLWWSNRSDPSVARVVTSAMDGTGAINVVPNSASGRVNTSVADPARNKLYWMERGTGKLWVSGLDGSNKSVVLQGAPAGIDPNETTYSLSIDPVSQKLYWVSTRNQDDLDRDRIRWATTDGSQYGTLYARSDPAVAGTFKDPQQIVIDREHNRIWWGNYDTFSGGVNPSYGYANLDGSGDAHAIDLTCVSTTGGPTIYPDDASGIVVDYAAGKIYGQVELAFDAAGHFMAESNLDGSDCRQITEPYTPGQSSSKGLALDPDTQWLYNARGKLGTPPLTDPLIEYLDLKGTLPAPTLSSLQVSPREFVNNARWPFILKAPKLTPASVSASGSEPGATLTLSGGDAVDDEIPMRVYRGATTQSVKWYRDGVEIPGQTDRTLTATESGVYKAVSSAGNYIGDSSVTSNEVTISAKPSPGPTPTPSNAFTVRTPLLVGTGIRTIVRVPGAGVIRQAGTFRSGGKVRQACGSGALAPPKAGVYRLRCRLTDAVRAQRRKGAVRVRLVTTYKPTGGTARAKVQTVVLRSLKPRFTG